MVVRGKEDGSRDDEVVGSSTSVVVRKEEVTVTFVDKSHWQLVEYVLTGPSDRNSHDTAK